MISSSSPPLLYIQSTNFLPSSASNFAPFVSASLSNQSPPSPYLTHFSFSDHLFWALPRLWSLSEKKKPIRRLCDVEMGSPWRCLLRWLFIDIGAVFVRSPRTETDVQGMLPSSPPGPFVLDTLYSLSRWAWLCNYRLGKRVCLFNSQTAWAV